jgi:hypothetical protein
MAASSKWPRKIPSIDPARELFALAVVVVERMASTTSVASVNS